MIIGHFDFGVIAILVLLNIIFWKKKIKNGCWVGLLFCLFLPFISQVIEVGRVSEEREIYDSFTLLYTYLKYPIYLLLCALQMRILNRNEDD